MSFIYRCQIIICWSFCNEFFFRRLYICGVFVYVFFFLFYCKLLDFNKYIYILPCCHNQSKEIYCGAKRLDLDRSVRSLYPQSCCNVYNNLCYLAVDIIGGIGTLNAQYIRVHSTQKKIYILHRFRLICLSSLTISYKYKWKEVNNPCRLFRLLMIKTLFFFEMWFNGKIQFFNLSFEWQWNDVNDTFVSI